jgi:CRP-like cAMP-binding protein
MDIFHDLTIEEMAALEHATHMFTIPRGQMLRPPHEATPELFLLKQGRIRLVRYDNSGKKLELAILEPGAFFGEMPLLGVCMRQATAEAIDDCLLCSMQQKHIEQLIFMKPQVGLRMLATVGRRLIETEDRLHDLAYRTVPARLASVLLRLTSPSDTCLKGFTHQDLAEMIGAYRETVTKTLNEFQAAGMIALGRKSICVLNRPKLFKLLEGQ